VSAVKQPLNRWQAAVLVYAMRSTLIGIGTKIALENRGCGSLITNAEIDDFQELLDYIESVFDGVDFALIRKDLLKLHRYAFGEGESVD
jgi:hypothetical protein